MYSSSAAVAAGRGALLTHAAPDEAYSTANNVKPTARICRRDIELIALPLSAPIDTKEGLNTTTKPMHWDDDYCQCTEDEAEVAASSGAAGAVELHLVGLK